MSYTMISARFFFISMLLVLYTATGFAANGHIEVKPLERSEESFEEDGGEEPAYQKGKIRIKPMITVGSRYDSNFYKSEADEKDVYTYFFKPGILLGYETAKSSVYLRYILNATFYNKEGDDYLGHALKLWGRTKPFDRLSLGLDESYYRTRRSELADRFSDTTNRELYTINRLTPMLLYEFENKFSVGLRYRNTIVTSDLSTAEDSIEHRGVADLIYRFTPKSSLGLEYQHWKRSYDGDIPDYSADYLQLIFKKQFHYFSFQVGSGYQNRQFSGEGGDDGVFTYRIALMGQNPPLPETRPRSYIRFVAEQNFNDPSINNLYFKANQFTLDVGRVFQEKILANMKARYILRDYKNWAENTAAAREREDDVYGLSTGVSYMFNDWLKFRAELGYETRDSNISGYDYDNTYFQVSMDSEYDFAGPEAEVIE